MPDRPSNIWIAELNKLDFIGWWFKAKFNLTTDGLLSPAKLAFNMPLDGIILIKHDFLFRNELISVFIRGKLWVCLQEHYSKILLHLKMIFARDFCHKEDFSYCAYTQENARSFRMGKKLYLRLVASDRFLPEKTRFCCYFTSNKWLYLKKFIRRTIFRRNKIHLRIENLRHNLLLKSLIFS